MRRLIRRKVSPDFEPRLQQVLADPVWMQRMGPDDLRALTPLIYAHVNPYGVFRLDMAERLLIEVMAS